MVEGKASFARGKEGKLLFSFQEKNIKDISAKR